MLLHPHIVIEIHLFDDSSELRIEGLSFYIAEDVQGFIMMSFTCSDDAQRHAFPHANLANQAHARHCNTITDIIRHVFAIYQTTNYEISSYSAVS